MKYNKEEQEAIDNAPPICANCKHSRKGIWLECGLTKRIFVDKIDGEVHTYYASCRSARAYKKPCGPEGSHYERAVSKDSWWGKLIDFFDDDAEDQWW